MIVGRKSTDFSQGALTNLHALSPGLLWFVLKMVFISVSDVNRGQTGIHPQSNPCPLQTLESNAFLGPSSRGKLFTSWITTLQSVSLHRGSALSASWFELENINVTARTDLPVSV